MNKEFSYAFFGTGALAESVLAQLVHNGHIPKLIVTKPDAPAGRHMVMTSPHIKTWGNLKGIPVFQPESLKNLGNESPLHAESFDLFIVASYGKIIPEAILNIPTAGVLNVHPSLLPAYRGASPIQSALLDDAITLGVSIMKLDKEMDHGPILVQAAFPLEAEATAGTLEVTCGQLGGELLLQTIPHYIEGTLIPKEQDHTKATYCTKIEKPLGEIRLSDDALTVRKKFRALTPWPSLFFFIEHQGKEMRVKVASVDLRTPCELNALALEVITSVIPEGKKEMDFESFKRGYL